MKWHAFHVSVDGIRRLSFPVVLERPRRDQTRLPQDNEEVWILGRSENAEAHFHVSSRTTGLTAGGGGGTGGLGTVKVDMPPIADAGFRSEVSMLPAHAIEGQPAESVEAKSGRIIELVRGNGR